MLVRPRSAALVTGVIVGIYLAAVLASGGAPDWLVALFGGPNGVARDGGLELAYRPPAGTDPRELQHRLAERGARVSREDGVLVIEVAGVAEGEADRTAAIIKHGGLQLREVLEDRSLLQVPHEGGEESMYVAPGVRLMIDTWHAHEDGRAHGAAYLAAGSPEELRRVFQQLRESGWESPPNSIVAIEPIRDDVREDARWRSYWLGSEVLLDGQAVARAQRTTDSNTFQVVVVLELTMEARERFAEITTNLAGGKLAILLGRQVQSAPIIAGPIRNGRASIVLDTVEEADALVAALSIGPLPAGGVVERHGWIAPAQIGPLVSVAIASAAVVVGAVFGLLAWLVVRITRPTWVSRPRRRAGRFPLRRFAVTLLAPAALVALDVVGLPGIEVELPDRLLHLDSDRASLFSARELGLGPVFLAFVVVELATLVTARRRRARYRPATQITLGRYVATLSVVFAIVVSYLLVENLARVSEGGVGELVGPGAWTQIPVMASLVAGTMVLVIVAGVIREHGLGNGYGALIASSWLFSVIPSLLYRPTAGHALGLVTFVATGVTTTVLLRMRIDNEREVPVRVPSSGVAPMTSAIAVLFLLGFFAGLGVSLVPGDLHSWLLAHPMWPVAIAFVLLTPLWSWAFARPGVVAPLAAHTTLTAPSLASWRRATLLSFLVLLGIVTMGLVSAAISPEATLLYGSTTAMLVAAVLLDARDELRVRRAALVSVWPLHHPQHAELVRRVLADAGIECHLQSSHLRALLCFFGPFVPIDVLVPAAAADEARSKIGALFQEVALHDVFA